MSILPSQCRAARGIVDMDQAELARRADVPRDTGTVRDRGRTLLPDGLGRSALPWRPPAYSSSTRIARGGEARSIRAIPPQQSRTPSGGPGDPISQEHVAACSGPQERRAGLAGHSERELQLKYLERSAFRLTHILSSSDSWHILVVEWP